MGSRTGRRRRLLLRRWLGAGTAVVAVAAAAVLLVDGGEPVPYTPGERVEGVTATLVRGAPAGEAPVRYANVAAMAGVEVRHFPGGRSSQLPEDMGSGVAWGDYDGDGFPDLFVSNVTGALTERESWAQSPGRYRLFHNEGDGSFRDVTDEAGVGARVIGMGAAFGDADGDGDLDLLAGHQGGLHYWRNLGGGRFEEATTASGLDRPGPWAGVSWGDHDRDGDLDLYVTGYVRYSEKLAAGAETTQYEVVIPASLNPSVHPPAPNLLLENDGTGRFTDVTGRAGVANERGRSLGAAWCHLDEDGWPDLYVANDISDNVLYRNRGGGSFEDLNHAAWVADFRGAMGLAVTDYDGDGDQDLFVSHWIAQENALYSNLLRHRSRQSEQLRFVDDADRVGLGQVALDHVGWGAVFLDFDRDARPDLFVTNGGTFQQEVDPSLLVPEKPLLFWNLGPREGFLEIGEQAGPYFGQVHVGRGAASADHDRDGDVDLAVLHHGGRLALLRAESEPAGHWLEVDLRGRASNSFGVGARVQVETAEALQAQVVGATPSYLSQPELTLHFGLGPAASALLRLAEVRLAQGRFGEAERLLAQVRRANSHSVGAPWLLAWLARREGRLDDAASLLAEASARARGPELPTAVPAEGDTRGDHRLVASTLPGKRALPPLWDGLAARHPADQWTAAESERELERLDAALSLLPPGGRISRRASRSRGAPRCCRRAGPHRA